MCRLHVGLGVFYCCYSLCGVSLPMVASYLGRRYIALSHSLSLLETTNVKMSRVKLSTLQSAAVQGQSMRARTPRPLHSHSSGWWVVVAGLACSAPPRHHQQPIRNFLVFVPCNLDWRP